MTVDLLERDPVRIESMFDELVPRYDLMNRVMTFGLDRSWRALAVRQLPTDIEGRALDLCCGTGDLTLALAGAFPALDVVGVDFSTEMIAAARRKAAAWAQALEASPPQFVRGDALRLPFENDWFSVATVGWGLRNVNDLAGVLSELLRVLRPGGRLVCLESTWPRERWARALHGVWMGYCVPALGSVVARQREAYSYLPASVQAFPRVDELAARMARSGFNGVRYRSLGLRAVAIHVGDKPLVALSA